MKRDISNILQEIRKRMLGIYEKRYFEHFTRDKKENVRDIWNEIFRSFYKR